MKLKIQHFAQIANAEINFGEAGDLTILVGQQATGKSLVVQWLKLVTDGQAIRADWEQYGTNWQDGTSGYTRALDAFFGEGIGQAFDPVQTVIEKDNKAVKLSNLFRKPKSSSKNSQKTAAATYVIPAHRALLLSRGWPDNFQQPIQGTPYVARVLTEKLARYLGDKTGSLFPIKKILTNELRQLFDEAVFHNAKVDIDTSSVQKRLVLTPEGMSNKSDATQNKAPIPYMAWTAGQREFAPLLLALYELIPSGSKSKDSSIETVVIEEPELGLHPKALFAIGVAILHLMARGYRVVITTHSPLMVDFAWSLNRLRVAKQNGKADSKNYRDVFEMKSNPSNNSIIDKIMTSHARAYYLSYSKPNGEPLQKVHSKDISHLRTYSQIESEPVWGELLQYSSRMADCISQLDIDFSTLSEKDLTA